MANILANANREEDILFTNIILKASFVIFRDARIASPFLYILLFSQTYACLLNPLKLITVISH